MLNIILFIFVSAEKGLLINNSVLTAVKKGGGREGIIDCNLNMQYCSIFVVIEKEVEGF